MTQIAFRLSMLGRHNEEGSQLNASRFVAEVDALGLFSRNTATTFLGELEILRLLTSSISLHDRRQRILFATESFSDMIRLDIRTQLHALDLIDGCDRTGWLSQRDWLLPDVQCRFFDFVKAENLLIRPPPTINHFIGLGSGYLVLDELMDRWVDVNSAGQDIQIPSLTQLATNARLSVSNLKRMLIRARDDGLVSWTTVSRHTEIRLSDQLLAEIVGWYARRMAVLDRAVSEVAATQPHGTAAVAPQ